MRAADLALIDAARDDDVPLTTASALLGGRPLLVLAPHPDDESLGCGGLLAAAFSIRGPRRGAHVVCLTDGAGSHPGSSAVSPADLAVIRRRELVSALIHLGGTEGDLTWVGAPDRALDATRAIVDKDCGHSAQLQCGFAAGAIAA